MKTLTKKERAKVGPLLRRARKLMNDNGAHWLKSRLAGRKGGEPAYCALGGLNAAAGAPQGYMDRSMALGKRRLNADEYPVLAEARMTLATVIARGRRPRNLAEAEGVIFRYNDDYRRSWDQISRALERASEEADRQIENPTT